MFSITITNDFHHTEHTIRKAANSDDSVSLTPRTVRRIRTKLCGCSDCTCAHTALGTRGRQTVDIVGHSDGSVTLYRL